MKKYLILFLAFISVQAIAQVDLGYQKPAKEILDLVDAPLPPRISISDDGERALLMYRKAYKSIAELSEKEMRLAGLRINPKADIGSRQRYYYDAQVLDVESGTQRAITGLPTDPRLTYFTWSPDENHVAFVLNTNDHVELWVIDMATAQAKRLSEVPLSANMGRPFTWAPNSKSLLVKTIPTDRNAMIDADAAIPDGPTISVNDGKKAQNRTYQDLLKNKNDEANFETLCESEVMWINLDGETKKWLPKGMWRGMNYSPDGDYVLVTQTKRPFSYIVPYYRFPTTIAVYDKKGNLVETIEELPLREVQPKGFMATYEGRRSISWRADASATLYWAEALDGGDPENEVSHRDQIYMLEAPFEAEPTPLIKTINRYSGVMWGEADVALAYDYWWNTRNTKTYLFNPSDPVGNGRIVNDRNYQDRYSDPGDPATRKNQWNKDVLLVDEDKIYLMGDGYSDKGVYPFVDEYSLTQDKTTRLWEASDTTMLERLVQAMDMKKGKILTRLEGPSTFPNYYFRNIKTGELTPVTQFENPFAAMGDLHKEVISYKRDDGIDLSGTLYLPSNYEEGKKYPMIMWAYPREFKDKKSAGQVTSSPNEFTYPWYGSPIFWALRGYVILDDAAFPILGGGDEEPNDSFREQLVGNAKAGIDAVDAMGYIDRNRVGVGGHSYGAFMTANLLSHSDLFAAGVARSGAYNRTLTPFGFQAEERNYWEAPEIYYTMSPFMHADKMKTPLLLIHGEEDNNSGTYPMQSERYFNALKGLGATARLVMLPKESHGYAARESILHVLWEQDTWFEKYVKNREVEQ